MLPRTRRRLAVALSPLWALWFVANMIFGFLPLTVIGWLTEDMSLRETAKDIWRTRPENFCRKAKP